MRIVFRADGSTRLGLGHVMRCLALAKLLRDDGFSVEFISRESRGLLKRLVQEEHGFLLHELPADTDPQADARLSREVLVAGPVPEWLIVDNYSLDIVWERSLRPYSRRIMVIDDLADRAHDCDLLLDQNFTDDKTRYDRLVPAECLKLIGTRYTVLRPEFRKYRDTKAPQDVTPERLFVFFGGGDPGNETAKALRALQALDRPGLHIDVVAGASNPHLHELRELASKLPHAQLHVDTADMAELMAGAQLALGAGGSSSWERCCLGLPSIVVSVADNQSRISELLASEGAILYLGTSAEVSVQDMARAVELASNKHLRCLLKQRGLALVDGKGGRRVANFLRNQVLLTVRSVTESDCRTIFEWRNDPATRRYSTDPRPLRYKDHESWFHRSLQDSNRIQLVGEYMGKPCSVLRYDLDNDNATATLSVFVSPDMTGLGIGPSLLLEGERWLRDNAPAISRIIGVVDSGNYASRAMFTATGYTFPRLHLEKVIHP